MTDGIEQFTIGVDGAALDDLRDRLRRTRWPERETVGDWSQGVPLGYLQDLCGYWASHYDWRATEARINQIPQFMTRIDDLQLHFLHLRSPHPDAIPLILTHGWPGSFFEFERVLGPLAVTVPAGCSIFPKETPRPSRRWAQRRFANIVYWSEPDRGGHFAAWEQPGLFTDEVRAVARATTAQPVMWNST